MVILEHVGRLQVFVIDRVVLSNERQRRFVVKILSLARTKASAVLWWKSCRCRLTF